MFRRETGAEGSDGKSIFEMQSEERDAKRRRINYKQAKKIHTSNKTHTEVFYIKKTLVFMFKLKLNFLVHRY